MANGGEVIFKFTGDDSGLEKTMKNLGGIAKKIGKTFVATTGAVAVGFAGIVTASVKARGEMEQLEGGIKKLFGESASLVEENAKRAYKTAGISATEYMNQVTNFSASLISSLKGDTQKATEIADRAIKDMADNANTFGTSIESIQNAYQGFAKQNYTMLDNLKLGYAGTKEGMQKLIKDAYSYKDIQKELNIEVQKGSLDFANIANAISVVQKHMEIMGTTANEAEGTLTGSLASAKAAWDNFLSGTGDLSTFVDSASIALDNILRIVDEALPDIMGQIQENMPKIMELGGKILMALVDGIIEYMPQILDVVILIIDKVSEAMLQNGDKLGEISVKLMEITAKGFLNAIPHVLLAISNVIGAILLAITEANGELWQAGFDLMKEMITGIRNKISEIQQTAEKVKNVIKNVLTALKHEAKQWGIDMIIGFANGVMEKMGALKQKVEDMANAIRSKLHFSRPDEGPLRDYETWLPDMIYGMAKSLDNASPYLINKVNDLASAMSMSPTINGNVNNIGSKVNVVVQNNMEVDPLGQVVNQIKTFSNGAKNDYNYGYGG